MHRPYKRRKAEKALLLAFCITFIAFTFLQLNRSYFVSLLTRPKSKNRSFQSPNTTDRISQESQHKHPSRNPLFSRSTLTAAPQQSRPSSTGNSAVRKKPLIVYRDKNGKIRACVLPRVCSEEPVIPGVTKKGMPTFYIPHEYRRFDRTLSQCISPYSITSSFQFYRGEKPSNDSTWYNIDVLGRSCTARWHGHFAHFIFHFSKRVLVATSLFRSQGKSTLPRPQCIYPSNNESLSPETKCRNGAIDSLKPQILISHLVLKRRWTRRFLQFIAHGIQIRQISNLPLFHVTEWSGRTKDAAEQRIECYRSLITTPEYFSIDRPGHDSLLESAGIERMPKCDRKPHIVLLSREYFPGYHRRKILNATLYELQSELYKASNASVEWVYGLGKLNFSEQVKLMQRADILVTVHGAELANALFLRRGARIIELFPFGFNTPYYKNTVADPIHVKHVAYATNPDPLAFYKCIESSANKDPLGEARRIFRKQISLYRNAKNESQRQKAGLFFAGSGPRESCIKSQVAEFNPRILARLISREARTRCNHVQ